MSLFSSLIVLPLCIPKDISFLRHASIVGVLACIYVVIIVVVKYFIGSYIPGNIRTKPQNPYDFFSSVPAIFFAYQCHVSAVPVFHTLKNKSSRSWFVVITSAMMLCFCTYTLTAICGYLTFGDDVQSDVLQSYDADDVSVLVARVAIFVAMLASYPVVHFCGRAAVTTLLIKSNIFDRFTNRERRRRVITTLIWFILSLVLALFIPTIGKAIALVGGLAGCFILIFPGLCFVQLYRNDFSLTSPMKKMFLVMGITLMLFGVFLFGEITTQAIINDIHSDANNDGGNSCYNRHQI